MSQGSVEDVIERILSSVIERYGKWSSVSSSLFCSDVKFVREGADSNLAAMFSRYGACGVQRRCNKSAEVDITHRRDDIESIIAVFAID